MVQLQFFDFLDCDMRLSNDKTLSLRIASLQGLYWMIFCPIYSFASIYLLSKGFTNQKIGWVLAVNSILAVLLQPVIGSAADRFKKIPLKVFIGFLSLLCILMLSGIPFLNVSWLWIAIIYCLILALMQTMQPLVNSLIFQYINAGYNVSFGATRAMGSISFAILSTALGIWLNTHSPEGLPLVGAALLVVLVLLVAFFPSVERLRKPAGIAQELRAQVQMTPPQGFMRKYDHFFILLIGVACLFIFPTIVTSFLAQIMTPLGAQKSDFGVSLTIAALCEIPAFLGFNFLVKRFNIRFLLKISGVFYALRSLIFLFATSIWMVNLGQVFQGLSFAIFIPASVYYVNHLMKDEDKVKGQTFVTGAMTLGGVVGSLVGGWMLDKFSVFAMLTFAAAAAATGCLLVIYSIRKEAVSVQNSAQR